MSVLQRLLLAASIAVMGCEATFPTGPRRGTASLRLQRSAATPSDARVTIDEEAVGPLAVVAARGVALPPGAHQVTVEAPGYFPWDKLVESKPDTAPKIDLTVDLVRVPE